MKRIGLILVFLVALFTTASAQDEVYLATYSGDNWFDDHIEFVFDFAIAENTVPHFYPATDNSLEWVEITFQNYSASEGWFNTGAYVAVGLLSTVPQDSSAFDIEDLLNNDDPQASLDDGYASWMPARFGSIDDVTELLRLDSDVFAGIRFVTEGNYVYEGVSLDGRYVVSVGVPLALNSDTEWVIGLGDGLATSIAFSGPDASFLARDTGGAINFEGVEFTHDPELAYRIEVDSRPQLTVEDAEFTMFGAMPSQQIFSFVGYPIPQRSFVLPEIFIMPVAEFPEVGSPYGNVLAQLTDILENRPDLFSYRETTQQALPIMPVINAGQIIVAYANYVTFDGGVGIRYITYHAQEAFPVTDDALFYTFLGLTEDGETVISARFPLYLETLPTFEEALAMDYDAFLSTYQTYIDDLRVEITELRGSAFVPSTDHLDSMINSLVVR